MIKDQTLFSNNKVKQILAIYSSKKEKYETSAGPQVVRVVDLFVKMMLMIERQVDAYGIIIIPQVLCQD